MELRIGMLFILVVLVVKMAQKCGHQSIMPFLEMEG